MRRRRAAAARRAQLHLLNAQGPQPAKQLNPATAAAEAHALLTPALPPLALPTLGAQAAPGTPVLAVKDTASPAPPVLAAPAPRKVLAPAWPSAWRSMSSNGGELRFSVRAPDGRNAGLASWTRVNAPQANASVQMRGKTLGGVVLGDLRRKVIDRMLAEGGWVVNDMEREIGGRRTFVVVCESANAEGAHLSWVFYFTELNGQVYSLMTSARTDTAAVVAADAEQFVGALNARTNDAMTANMQR